MTVQIVAVLNPFFLQELEIVNNPSFLNVHPFRKEMAKELLVGNLRVLQSAHSWVATYCENLSKS
jgi:hypothetical protein